ncbi:MAG: dihydroxy-acid dehydratase [Enterocloster clostridioformis]|nr:dihydroxy-acid dehydratase [Enterocloster clostridioformis]
MGGSANGILHLQAIYHEAGLGELPRFSYTNNGDMLKTAKEHFAPTGGAAWCVFSRCCSALCSISLWRGQRSFPGMYSLS